MGRAEDLFKRLTTHGDAAIDQMILGRQSEELFLDFKRSADNASGLRLHDGDRGHLARAISGFGNSEGGIIIWGVECSGKSFTGDVATAKVLLHDAKRFLSWLESAVSGCTLPAHPGVRHFAIEGDSSGAGYVVTLIPRSHLAPHQCVRPPHYYIRAGSSFLPAPHGVLAGLFGRVPQPFVFHMWQIPPASLAPLRPNVHAAVFTVGFMLGSHGPGIARDLYVNIKMLPPGDATTIAMQIMETNWTGRQSLGVCSSFVAADAFKLAPEATVTPLTIHCQFAPPFERDFWYEITFGHASSPIRKIEVRRTPTELQAAYNDLVAGGGATEAGRRFVESVMGLEDSDERGPECYDS